MSRTCHLITMSKLPSTKNRKKNGRTGRRSESKMRSLNRFETQRAKASNPFSLDPPELNQIQGWAFDGKAICSPPLLPKQFHDFLKLATHLVVFPAVLGIKFLCITSKEVTNYDAYLHRP